MRLNRPKLLQKKELCGGIARMSNYLRFPLAALVLLSIAPSATPQSHLDPDILSMVAQVDADRIAADIQTLVDFGTRNTCSDNSGASPGIGAARDWIQTQFAALPGLRVR